MTTINHSRPYLRYIDNIKREFIRSCSLNVNYKFVHSDWSRLDSVKLSVNQYESIIFVLRNLNELLDIDHKIVCKRVSGFRERNTFKIYDVKNFKESIEELNEIKTSLINRIRSEFMKIIEMDLIKKEKAVLKWFNTYSELLLKDGGDTVVEYISVLFDESCQKYALSLCLAKA